jgi:hypothetical protein
VSSTMIFWTELSCENTTMLLSGWSWLLYHCICPTLIDSIFSFMCMFCGSLLVLFFFFFWPVLSVLLRNTESDYPFSIIKLMDFSLFTYIFLFSLTAFQFTPEFSPTPFLIHSYASALNIYDREVCRGD